MRGKKEHFVHFNLDKELYEQMHNVPADNLSELTNREISIIAKPKHFMKFASLQEKLHMYSRCGGVWVLTLLKRQKYQQRYIDRLVTLLFKNKVFHRPPIINQLEMGGVVFLGDTEIIRSMQLASALQNGKPMGDVVDTIYAATTRNKELFAEQNANTTIDNIVSRAMNLVTSPDAQRRFSILCKLNYQHYIILSQLAKYRHLTEEQVRKNAGLYRYRKELKELKQHGMIDLKKVTYERTETIAYFMTAHGELCLQKARSFFIN